jgi:hypothetical protein
LNFAGSTAPAAKQQFPRPKTRDVKTDAGICVFTLCVFLSPVSVSICKVCMRKFTFSDLLYKKQFVILIPLLCLYGL